MHATAYPAEGWIISLDAKAQRLERNMNSHSGNVTTSTLNRSEISDKRSVVRFLNECTVCDRKGKSKTDLDEHMKKHTNRRWVMKKVMRIHSWIVRQGEMKKNGYQTDDTLLIG